MTRHRMLGEIEADAYGTDRNARFGSTQFRDNREPSTRREVLSCGGCWCELPVGHDWPGKADGAPHPRGPVL